MNMCGKMEKNMKWGCSYLSRIFYGLNFRANREKWLKKTEELNSTAIPTVWLLRNGIEDGLLIF